MSKRPARDDLFAIFPDLPWQRPHRLVAKQIERVHHQARQTRLAGESIWRPRRARRVRAAIA